RPRRRPRCRGARARRADAPAAAGHARTRRPRVEPAAAGRQPERLKLARWTR
ncbi:MAG: hypothetical protein OEW27_16585, partial [Aquincola sp.]|nr:hypothetical protein [Aquincola sp.]